MKSPSGTADVPPAIPGTRAGRSWPHVFSLLLALFVAVTPLLQAGYKIENVPYPPDIRGGISAVTFTPSGALVIATRFGEVWIRSSNQNWRLFTRGLDEPMGLPV